tara:strand:- start:123 stop:353 length:231 start_codon:yes stop_codon:yes gene_type:complete
MVLGEVHQLVKVVQEVLEEDPAVGHLYQLKLLVLQIQVLFKVMLVVQVVRAVIDQAVAVVPVKQEIQMVKCMVVMV